MDAVLPKVESVRIRGFRSLADIELSGMPQAAVLIGANGAGKSNFVRFFEMLGWMLRLRRLGEFVERHGGAGDQLFGGSKVTALPGATTASRSTTRRPIGCSSATRASGTGTTASPTSTAGSPSRAATGKP